MRKEIVGKILFVLLAAVVVGLATATVVDAAGEKVKGRILGETCVKKGKIGECYLKWAHPMVLWTEIGETYRIDLVGEGLDQSALDKAFGREVVMEGWVVGNRLKVTKLTVLDPGVKKEFFKG